MKEIYEGNLFFELCRQYLFLFVVFVDNVHESPAGTAYLFVVINNIFSPGQKTNMTSISFIPCPSSASIFLHTS